ncbi:MAG: hypothetical protein NVSMB27_10100 [Ktedonobacteraceae bacterium]
MKIDSPMQQSTPSSENEHPLLDRKLLERKLYQHDPLLVLFRDKLHLNNSWMTMGIAVLAAIVLLILPTLAGPDFDLQSRSWDHTLRPLFQTAVLFPLIFLLYLVLPQSIADLFITLKDNETIGERRRDQDDSESYERLLQKLVSLADSGWWIVVALLYITLYWVYRLAVIDPGLSPSKLEPLWLRVAILFTYSPIIYASFISIVRFLAALLFTRKIFNTFIIQIKPLHPDGSGGLGTIGHMLIISAGVMVTMGIAILVMNTSFLLGNTASFSQFEGIILATIYVILVPATLIGWLWIPHQVMVEDRDAVLHEVAAQFQLTILEIASSPHNDIKRITINTLHLSKLKARYELLKETYPTWPLEVVQIRQLVLLALIPAIGAIIPVIFPILVTFIKNLLQP